MKNLTPKQKEVVKYKALFKLWTFASEFSELHPDTGAFSDTVEEDGEDYGWSEEEKEAYRIQLKIESDRLHSRMTKLKVTSLIKKGIIDKEYKLIKE